MSFFGDISAGQLLEQVMGFQIKKEEIRATAAGTAQKDRDLLLNSPPDGAVSQPTQPSAPSQPSNVMVGGVPLNPVALYVAGGALFIALLAWLLK